MLRISPRDKGERIVNAIGFRIEPGGSESNAAIALSNLGNQVAFITKLPDNPLGHKILRSLKGFDIDTRFIILGKGRLGTYWTENGVSQRASDVIYDRENSAFSRMSFKEIDISFLKSNVKWFHTSGITPAISRKTYELLNQTLKSLPEKTKVSVDLNYRSKLWNWLPKKFKKKLHAAMKIICKNAFLITANETDFHDALGYKFEANDKSSYMEIAKEAFTEFSNLKHIGISLRHSHSASENRWSGMLFCKVKGNIESYQSTEYNITDIEDRVGTGDSFSAGIIHGLLHYGKNYQRTIDFAAALSALNHTIKGDSSQFSKLDVENVLQTKGSGRIMR